LQTGKQSGAATLDFSNLNSASWPLISKVYAGEVYKAQYNIERSGVVNGAIVRLSAMTQLIPPMISSYTCDLSGKKMQS